MQMFKSALKGKPTDHCPICSSLEEKVTNQIIKCLQKKSFVKGSVIFCQESDRRGLCLLSKGTVKVSRISPHGKEVILAMLHPGNTFGESGLFSNSLGSDLITANEDVELFCLSKEDFQQITVENPQVYQKAVGSLIQWMDKLNAIIENINTPSARDRVTAYIKRLVNDQNSSLIHLDGKKHEVALMLGLRPETFSRVLSDLEESGAVKLNHKQIQILNINFL